MTAPSDNSFSGGMQGGFLLQNNGSVTGQVVYSIFLPSQQAGGTPPLCNAGAPPTSRANPGHKKKHHQRARQTRISFPATPTPHRTANTNNMTHHYRQRWSRA